MKRLFFISLALIAGTLVYAFFTAGTIRNYLPDLLWAWALCQTVLWMKEREFQPVFIYSLLALPFLTEIGQAGLFPGTFDWNDLLLYAGLYLVFFYTQILSVCKKIQKFLSAARSSWFIS